MKNKTYWTKNKFTGEKEGPFSFKEIATLIWDGNLGRQDLIKPSGANSWVIAESLLDEVFTKVEVRKGVVSEGESAVSVPRIEKNKSSAKGKFRGDGTGERSNPNENQPRRFRRITPLGLIFGRLSPSPYSGFWLMKLTINILIGFGIFNLVSSVGDLVIEGVSNPLNDGPVLPDLPGQIGVGADWTKLNPELVRLKNNLMFVGFFFQIVWIVVLIFFRNMIDWLIDMEDHANAIRQQTIN